MMPSIILKSIMLFVSVTLVFGVINPFKRRQIRSPMKNLIVAAVLIIGVILLGVTGCDKVIDDNFPTATPTVVVTLTPTNTPTPEPEPTETLVPSATPTPTLPPTPTMIPLDGECLNTVERYYNHIRMVELEEAWDLLDPVLQKSLEGGGTFEAYEAFWSRYYIEGQLVSLTNDGCRVTIFTTLFERTTSQTKVIDFYLVTYDVHPDKLIITGAVKQ